MEDALKCPYCGHAVTADDDVCPACGQLIAEYGDDGFKAPEGEVLTQESADSEIPHFRETYKGLHPASWATPFFVPLVIAFVIVGTICAI